MWMRNLLNWWMQIVSCLQVAPGRYRPACRMAHTGTYGTGAPHAACRITSLARGGKSAAAGSLATCSLSRSDSLMPLKCSKARIHFAPEQQQHICNNDNNIRHGLSSCTSFRKPLGTFVVDMDVCERVDQLSLLKHLQHVSVIKQGRKGGLINCSYHCNNASCHALFRIPNKKY